jgi:tetratricopeptide (TPR) repeat protein
LYLLTTGLAAQAPNPDALYRQRENLASARQAAEIWAKRAAPGNDFEASWKLARASYWIGTHGEEKERRAALEQGMKAAEQAAALNAARPEGHFWQAANMGALAESFGMMAGLRYRGRIKDALERVLKIDSAFQQGSADRAIGWWYHKVPGLFGGSEEKAEQHLRKALSYNPRSTVTLYFLAEVLLERGRKADALAMLQQVLDAPLDPDWGPEDRSFKATAARRLKELKK